MASILLVDDELCMLREVRLLLEDLGHSVSATNRLDYAIQEVKGSIYDCMVTDKNLDSHRGVEPLLDCVREHRPNMPVILMSAEDGARAQAELYCHAFVKKGGDFYEKLEETIARLVT